MTCAKLRQNWHKVKGVSREIQGHKPKGKNTMKEKKKLEVTLPVFIMISDRFHMTSRRPCWCSKTMKRRPYWCSNTNRVGIGLFSYVENFLCSHKLGLSVLSRNGPLVSGRVAGKPKMHDYIMLNGVFRIFLWLVDRQLRMPNRWNDL